MAQLSKRPYTKEDRSLEQYLQEIGSIKLLSREEEAELARRVKKGDREATEKLVKSNLRFVVSVAKRYQNQGLPLSDLINEGNMGLIKAAKRFDETRGYKFISYAVWWIRQAILQALAEQTRIVRLPLNKVGTLHKIGRVSRELEQELGRKPSSSEIAKELDISPDDVANTLKISSRHLSLDAPLNEDENSSLMDILSDDLQLSPDEILLESALKEDVKKAVSSLSEREATIIKLYFGIDRERPMTLEEIGERFNLTRERIRQIKEKAIRRLRHASKNRLLKAYLKEGE